ncbi:MAG: hypothetical protein KF889_18335 [Alphaproteobacteria bacterium]|nr:hypothetical protein [Alphaproteobacteria bacterium]MCW5743974.1 hypothetical protein [Alphaproteobacteria bacterium]
MNATGLALVLIVAGAAALAQNPTTGGLPGPGGGNPPTGWSGGATPPGMDTGKMHPDSKGQPAGPSTGPSTATSPPPGDAVRVTSESQARRVIEAEGFTRVRALRREADGTWSGRAVRGTSHVAVRVDQRGNVSAE